jgi:hypothetical protein
VKIAPVIGPATNIVFIGINVPDRYQNGNDSCYLIINHPMPCNRYCYPEHLLPWNTMFGDFEVNFLPELKYLHDAGCNYSILTY